MPRLAEITVQKVALEYLKKRYRRRAWMRKIFAKIEVSTKKEFGSKRADGLLAFRHWLWGTYVVSMEAKSFKTLPAMKPYRDDWQLVRNSLWAGLVVCILSGAFFWSYRVNDGLWQFLIPFNAFLGGAILYGFLTFRHAAHKKVDVIDQLQQYPANEQWLAFSQDSIDSLPYVKVKKLKKMARSQRIGIVVVQPKGKVKIIVKARMRLRWGKDFLRFYTKEKEIRKVIL
ncbi:MAG: hypothetical protein AB8G22_08540 [Saprospiraceae bacterium]